MDRLYIEDDTGNIKIVPIESDSITIGRAPDNVVVLPERNVSRHHARIRVENGRFFVEDAGARFGLKVNGQRIDGGAEISPGDLVHIGDFKIKVLAPDAAIPEKPVSATTETAIAPLTHTTMVNIRDIDKVAEIGWKSDFDLEEETGKPSAGKILLLVVLVVAAIGLGVLYWLLTAETEIPPPRSVVQPTVEQVATVPVAPEPVEPVRPVESPVKPEMITSPQPKSVKTEQKQAKSEVNKPQQEVRVAQTQRTPAEVEQSVDPFAEIDAALKRGDLAKAEELLKNCSGAGCISRWEKLANLFQAQGNATKAIEVYTRLRKMSRDPNKRQRYDKQIEALGGKLD